MTQKKILIVEDEAYILSLLEQTLEPLEERGVQLFTASDGRTGLALAEEHCPDVLVLDVMLPHLSGFDVATAIKANPVLQQMCIIILTARGEDETKQSSRDAGANFYLNKPFDPDNLLALVEKELFRVA